MSEFHIQKHTIHGSHLREYRQGVLDEAQDPWLAVKIYTPKSNPHPRYGDLTIIAAGGIGFVKEVYEPLFDDLEKASRANGYAIRTIWIADFYAIGASAVLNADNLGNMRMSSRMSRTHLSLLHPRLFTSLVLIEPSISRGRSRQAMMAQAKAIARRREVYADRHEVAASIMKSKYYAKWDPRAKRNLIEYGFVPVQGSEVEFLNEKSSETSVRAITSKHIEIMLMFKPNYEGYGDKGLDSMSAEARLAVPDIDPDFAANGVSPLYRPEFVSVYRNLPHVRPSVLYICGEASSFSTAEIRQERMSRTGVGPGGSGGAKLGRVKEYMIKGGVHTLPMDEHLSLVVEGASNWLADEMSTWRAEEARVGSAWADKPRSEKQQMDDVLHKSLLEWEPNMQIESIIKRKL